MKIRLLITGIIILSVTLGWGQSSLGYRYFEMNEISSKELIKSIGKDADGFIWLATDQGVLQYDGNETKLFYKEIPTPYTKGFIKTQSGKFLVLHDNGIKEIINNPDTTYFKPFIYTPDKNQEQTLNYPKAIFEDSKGNIWVGEYNALVKINDAGIKRYDLGEGFTSINYHRSFSFTEDAFGNLWIAPFKGKLLSYNKLTDSIETVNIDYPISHATTIITVKGDHILIGGREGIFKIKVDSDKNISEQEFFTGVQDIASAISITDREIFIGTWNKGLYQLNLTTKSFQKIDVVSFNDILGFEYDSEDQELWIAGSENVGLLKKVGIYALEMVGATRIESVDIDSKGVIYYSVGEQILKLNNNRSEAEMVLSAVDTYFDRILLENEVIWIGDAFGRISLYDLKQKQLQNFQEESGFSIKHIFLDSRGSKWFSGNPTSITRIDQNLNVRYYNVRNSAVIKESLSGNLICGVLGDESILYQYDKARDIFLPMKIDIPIDRPESIQVEDIAFDHEENLYLATDIGLLKVSYNNGSYHKAERIAIDGFDNNEPVRALAINGDFIWLANSYGLAIYRDGEAIIYTTENGLPSKILKERGLKIDPQNGLLVATAKGLALADTELNTFRVASKPIFKFIDVNGKKYKINSQQSAVFPYNSRLQAEFVTLFFPGSDIVYQTRILGLQDEWTKASSNYNISVLGFPEGTYTLEIRARNGGFQWSEPLRFSFEIKPPWFRTWWAYLLFLIILSVFTYISVKFYNQHLIRQKRKLQKVIEDRTEEINRQKNEIIEQKNKIIRQKEELLEKNKVVYESQHALTEADLKFLHLKEKQLQDQIDFKNKQITTHTLNILQKNTTLKDLRNKLEVIVKSPNGTVHNELKKSLRLIDDSFKLDKDWEDFKLYFEQVYTGFYAKLKINYPDLTTQELRHCALIRLNLNLSECASILGISTDSIKVSRTRLRKKLNIPNNGSLSDFIMGI